VPEEYLFHRFNEVRPCFEPLAKVLLEKHAW
jgi:hypothetical protein